MFAMFKERKILLILTLSLFVGGLFTIRPSRLEKSQNTRSVLHTGGGTSYDHHSWDSLITSSCNLCEDHSLVAEQSGELEPVQGILINRNYYDSAYDPALYVTSAAAAGEFAQVANESGLLPDLDSIQLIAIQLDSVRVPLSQIRPGQKAYAINSTSSFNSLMAREILVTFIAEAENRSFFFIATRPSPTYTHTGGSYYSTSSVYLTANADRRPGVLVVRNPLVDAVYSSLIVDSISTRKLSVSEPEQTSSNVRKIVLMSDLPTLSNGRELDLDGVEVVHVGWDLSVERLFLKNVSNSVSIHCRPVGTNGGNAAIMIPSSKISSMWNATGGVLTLTSTTVDGTTYKYSQMSRSAPIHLQGYSGGRWNQSVH